MRSGGQIYKDGDGDEDEDYAAAADDDDDASQLLLLRLVVYTRGCIVLCDRQLFPGRGFLRMMSTL